MDFSVSELVTGFAPERLYTHTNAAATATRESMNRDLHFQCRSSVAFNLLKAYFG